MTSCSEYVSLGHPDKTADYIASCLLDEYIKHDPKVRFGLEVQIKDHICNLAGEVTSTWIPSDEEISAIVKDAIRKVGYTAEYAAKWPEGATLNADKVMVNNFIGQQSPDIAQGVDRDGWGDQGVFMGMATTNKEFNYLPKDVYFAQEIGKRLYKAAKNSEFPIGLDIKVMATVGNSEIVNQVVVAAPMKEEDSPVCKMCIADIVFDVLREKNHTVKDLVINGTGSYVIHSSVGDAGVVGRKLAVDFYGLNCPVGGGSPWGKDATKADVTLNIYARYRALKTVLAHQETLGTVFIKIGCCIGQSFCHVMAQDAQNNVIHGDSIYLYPSETYELLGLNGKADPNMFANLCENGLFSWCDKVALQ